MCNSMSNYMNNSQSNLFHNGLFNQTKTITNIKLIDINYEQSLKENNISYQKTISEFDQIFKNVEYLNKKIQAEIFVLNRSRKQIQSTINKFFLKKFHF